MAVMELYDVMRTTAILPIGKPIKQFSKLTRKPVTDLASRERFDGEPFSA
jgi:hypothetical protein